MSFLHPAALAGLASLLVLVLLSLWRQRPARVVVPSVRLWERIPDRLPPVRALRRPQASLSLFLQMLVASAIVVAMAGPGIVRSQPAPRRIAVVVDTSAYMLPRLDDVRRELAKLDRSDDITLIESPSLDRRPVGSHFFTSFSGVGDPRPALDLAASEAKQIVYISDRAPQWSPPPGVTLNLALVGGPLKNTGIVDAGVEDGKLFLRLTEPAEIEVAVDGSSKRLPAASFHLIEIPAEAKRLTASLGPDEFSADDRVDFERAEAKVDVGFEGRPDASILAAIESNPRARVVRGGSPRLLIRVGSTLGESRSPHTVHIDPVEGVGRWFEAAGVVVASRHPLMRGVEPEDLRFVQVGSVIGLSSEVLIAGPLNEPIAVIRGQGDIVLAARWADSGWPARPSFPIFWANVLEYAASGVGTWSAKGLLNEAASRPGLDRKPLDPGAFGARATTPVRTELSGASIAVAGLLLAILWFAESRGRE